MVCGGAGLQGLRTVTRDDPLLIEGEELANRGSYEAAERKFSAAVARDPENARTYVYRADNRADMRDFTGALKDIDQALQLTRGQPAVYWIRATIFVRMGRFDDAAEDYSVAVERGYKTGQALSKRANCYYKGNRLTEAAADYRRLLHLEPHNIEHLECLAFMFHLAGKSKQAVRELDTRINWFRDRYRLEKLRREILEEQSFWDRLFG
jgi:tetratricopeptide (TPR) repeat protein